MTSSLASLSAVRIGGAASLVSATGDACGSSSVSTSFSFSVLSSGGPDSSGVPSFLGVGDFWEGD